jgi:hypothetical protein
MIKVTDWEENLQDTVSCKGLLSKIYEEFPQICNSKCQLKTEIPKREFLEGDV